MHLWLSVFFFFKWSWRAYEQRRYWLESFEVIERSGSSGVLCIDQVKWALCCFTHTFSSAAGEECASRLPPGFKRKSSYLHRVCPDMQMCSCSWEKLENRNDDFCQSGPVSQFLFVLLQNGKNRNAEFQGSTFFILGNGFWWIVSKQWEDAEHAIKQQPQLDWKVYTICTTEQRIMCFIWKILKFLERGKDSFIK